MVDYLLSTALMEEIKKKSLESIFQYLFDAFA